MSEVLKLIAEAVPWGILLSLVLIGPVFFLLIETSISKGVKTALALDFGVVFSDITIIVVAYYGSRDIQQYIEHHRSVYFLGAFLVLVFGLFMIIKKTELHMKDEGLVKTNYIMTFINGYMLNLLNIGVVMFWVTMVIFFTSRHPHPIDFFIYMGTILLTFLGIDILKIVLAKYLSKHIHDDDIHRIRKVVGWILVGFSAFIVVKGYFPEWFTTLKY